MTITWTPSDSTLLSVTKPNNIGLIVISANDSEAGDAINYSVATSNNIPSSIVVSSSSTGVTVSGDSSDSLKPVIKYIKNGTIITINSLSELLDTPPIEVVEYLSNVNQTEVYTLSVTAYFSNDTSNTKEYTLTVNNNWSGDVAALNYLLGR